MAEKNEVVQGIKEGDKSAAPGVKSTESPKPAATESEADSGRSGVITGDRSAKDAEEQVKTPEKELPLSKLGDNPATGRQGGQAGGR